MRILHLSNYVAVVESTRTGEKITIKDPDRLLFPHDVGSQLPIEHFEPVKITGIPPWIRRSDYFFPAEVNVDEQGNHEVVYAPYHDLLKYLYVDSTKWDVIGVFADNISPPINTRKVLKVLCTEGMEFLIADFAAKTGTGTYPLDATGSGLPVGTLSSLIPTTEELATFKTEFDSSLPAIQLVEKVRSLYPEVILHSRELFKDTLFIYFDFMPCTKEFTMPSMPLNGLSIKHNVDNYAVAVKALGATDVNGEHLQLSEASVIEGRLPQITKVTTHDNIWSLSELKLAQDNDLKRYKGYDISFHVNVHDLLPAHLRYVYPDEAEPYNASGLMPFTKWRVPSLQPAGEQDDYTFIVDRVVFDNSNPNECNMYFTTLNSSDGEGGLSRTLAKADPARSTTISGEAPKKKG